MTHNIHSQTWHIVFDEGRHARAKLGFVLLATEQTIATIFTVYVPQGL